jgi:hypothetical protein
MTTEIAEMLAKSADLTLLLGTYLQGICGGTVCLAPISILAS